VPGAFSGDHVAKRDTVIAKLDLDEVARPGIYMHDGKLRGDAAIRCDTVPAA